MGNSAVDAGPSVSRCLTFWLVEAIVSITPLTSVLALAEASVRNAEPQRAKNVAKFLAICCEG